MIAFCTAILSFVWRTGSSADPTDGQRPPLTDVQAICVRVLVTVVFALGVLNFVLIMRTFGSYGETESGRKGRWKSRFNEYRSANTDPERRPDSDDDRNPRRGRSVRKNKRRGAGSAGSGVMGLGLSGLGGREAGDDVEVILETAGVESKAKGLAKDDMFFNGGGMRVSPKL